MSCRDGRRARLRSGHRQLSLWLAAFSLCLLCRSRTVCCLTRNAEGTIGSVKFSPSGSIPAKDQTILFPRKRKFIKSRVGSATGVVSTPSSKVAPNVSLGSQNTSDSKKVASALLDGLRSGAASGAAAACVKTLLQPLDAMKTLQQFQQTGSSNRAITMLESARILMKRPGGVANFYAGLGVTVLGSIPGVAIYFGAYQFCRRKLMETEWGPKNKRVSIALSAAIGNTIASFSRTPYEVLKQKLQMGTYPTFVAALRAVLADPINSLFPKGGVVIQMMRDVPYAVATLLVYESLQEALLNRSPVCQQQKKQWDFVIGGIAGGVGSWLTNPMDVIKTRLQMDDSSASVYGGSVTACAAMLWKEGGAPIFLRGATPRLMHKIPANCFFFLFYEMFRRILFTTTSPSDHAQSQPEKKKS